MAEDRLHFAPVTSLDPGDYAVIDNLLLRVENTPREEIEDGIATVVGRTASHVASHRREVTVRVSTEQLVPRLDEDFNVAGYDIDAGRVLVRDTWPDPPVIYVDLAREVRLTDAYGGSEVVDVSGFYVRHEDDDYSGFHSYLSLDGKSILDQSAGDRIIRWRKARPADFVVEQEKTGE